MVKLAKQIARSLINLIIIIALIAGIAFFVMLAAGYQVAVVASGSMEGTAKDSIQTGSLCFTDTEYDYDELKVGDVIAFTNGKMAVTHRIYEMEDGLIRTKGDANEDPDPYYIGEEHVIGKVAFTIPYLGYAADWVQSPRGTILTATVMIALILLEFLVDDESKKKEDSLAKAKIEQEAFAEENGEGGQ